MKFRACSIAVAIGARKQNEACTGSKDCVSLEFVLANRFVKRKRNPPAFRDNRQPDIIVHVIREMIALSMDRYAGSP